jgi:hypothetical protein
MDKNRLLKLLIFWMFFIFILDSIGQKFYWYTSIWWFDMLTHFLSGFWVSLFFIYIFQSKEPILPLFIKIITCVLLIGILWEFFEVYSHNYIGQDPFNALDTVSDVFFDLAGGTFALLYYMKRIMLLTINKVE